LSKDVIFPDYQEEVEDNLLVLKSYIHVHLDCEFSVKVYLYQVTNRYIVAKPGDKKLAIGNHLRDCLRLSKYLILLPEDTLLLPLAAIVNKQKENFIEEIHANYP